MVLMTDDADRENEGDLVMAAEFVRAEHVNFMVTHARGLVCLPLTGAQIDRLGLPPMVQENTSSRGTAFTVSIEARQGVSTGISAADRAHTMRVAADPRSGPADLGSPGHVFPLRAAEGGVLARPGHTEGSLDLLRLAGLEPASVICEVMNADGTMARMPELEAFSRQHDIPLVTIAEIVAWRRATENGAGPDDGGRHGRGSIDGPSRGTDAGAPGVVAGGQAGGIPAGSLAAGQGPAASEPLVELVATSTLPNSLADTVFTMHAFRDHVSGAEHLVLVKGDPAAAEAPLVRLHSECVTGDVFGSKRCDCGEQLQAATRRIGQAPAGALLYLRGHEGRGIGLANKIRAYALQDEGLDTVEANHRLGFAADLRDWRVAAAILRHLGIHRPALLTNNPDKVAALAEQGIEVARQVPLEMPHNPFNRAYLRTKREKMGHSLAGRFEAASATDGGLEPDHLRSRRDVRTEGRSPVAAGRNIAAHGPAADVSVRDIAVPDAGAGSEGWDGRRSWDAHAMSGARGNAPMAAE
ncbi:3,4-dihydroxy-2-butanone-4-phosphate synthase [Acetobacteraceae bacterium KSS12]|uniref:GTP cyclohydrolase-2 n=1 Tax=Rhizosaccharibacter radicis TaxID=2782605 RepID=A0ABT1W0H8_9PROT|nr:3,4-dihydroxy-2-butanone-4-phosphate synthase [Acetobacteraceae bacterium KSS12]